MSFPWTHTKMEDSSLFDWYVGEALKGILANPTTFEGSGMRRLLGQTTAAAEVKMIGDAAVVYAADAMRAREEFLAGLDKGDGPPATTGGRTG